MTYTTPHSNEKIKGFLKKEITFTTIPCSKGDSEDQGASDDLL